jgi:G3E family GTPase
VVRAKGLLWLASRHNIAVNLSQAGPSIQFGPAGYWIASLPAEEVKKTLESDPEVRKDWDDTWGDRITELVFIGVEMNHEDIIKALDRCLLNDAEMTSDWNQLNDTLPAFVEAQPEMA